MIAFIKLKDNVHWNLVVEEVILYFLSGLRSRRVNEI